MDAVIRLDEVTKRGDSDAGPAVGGVGLHPAPGEAVAVLPAAGPASLSPRLVTSSSRITASMPAS